MSSGKNSSRKLPVTPIFVALVAGLATWTYYSQYKGAEEKTRVEEQAKSLLPFSNKDVDRIEIVRPQGRLVLARDAKGWRILEPLQDLADEQAVDQLLSNFSVERVKETVVEADDIAWATFGLQEPTHTVLIKTAAAERRWKIGSVKAYDGELYARIGEENKVVLLGGVLQAPMEKPAKELRDLRLFPVPPGAAHPAFQRMTLKTPSRTLVLEKSESAWRLKQDSTPTWPLEERKVTQLIDSVTALRGNEVLAEDWKAAAAIKAHRLNGPKVTAKLELASAADATKDATKDAEKEAPVSVYEASLIIPGTQEAHFAATSSIRPQVFQLTKAQLDRVHIDSDDLRDLKFPFTYQLADAVRVELVSTKSSMPLPNLKKQDGKWVLDSPAELWPQHELDAAKVESILSEIQQLEAIRVESRSAKLPKADSLGAIMVKILAAEGRELWSGVFAIEAVAAKKDRKPAHQGDHEHKHDQEPEAGAEASQSLVATSSRVPGRKFLLSNASIEKLKFEQIMKPKAPQAAPPASTEKPGDKKPAEKK